jgi:hypothetical protein
MNIDLEYQRRRKNRCSSKEETKYQNEDPGQQRNRDDLPTPHLRIDF